MRGRQEVTETAAQGGPYHGMIDASTQHAVADTRKVRNRAVNTRLMRSGPDEGGSDTDRDQEGGLAVETAKPKLKRPPMFKVLLVNDDYTPMEFVVHVLERFFAMNREKATQIMLTVHTAGSAVVGIFPRDIAETKSEQVNLYSQENQHPLVSTVEMTD